MRAQSPGAFPHDADASPHDAGASRYDAGAAPQDADASPHDAGAGPAAPARGTGRLHPLLGVARHQLRQRLAEHGFLPAALPRRGPALNPATGEQLRALVALSGGPDSLALAATAGFYARSGTFRVGAVIVDHQLQPGSAEVAQRAAAQARELGLDPVVVVPVTVSAEGEGPEAAARQARHAALESYARKLRADVVLLGHTLNDQAEQVLLALARGSGTRSLAGIPERRDFSGGTYLRPFLDLQRQQTEEICALSGLEPWQDPSNQDGILTRSRVRTRVLPMLEDELGPGVAQALHRSAHILGVDADYLDEQARHAFARLQECPDPGTILLQEEGLRELHPALRARVIALAVTQLGGEPTFERLQAAVGLLRRQGSAGPVQLPGHVSVSRQSRSRGAARGAARYGKLEVKSNAPAPSRHEAFGSG